jgi:hypothetical protein
MWECLCVVIALRHASPLLEARAVTHKNTNTHTHTHTSCTERQWSQLLSRGARFDSLECVRHSWNMSVGQQTLDREAVVKVHRNARLPQLRDSCASRGDAQLLQGGTR